MKKTYSKLKICLISSRGGHLFQLHQLKPIWQKYKRFWITEKGEDADSLLKNEHIYYGYFPVTRNCFHAIANFFLGVYILSKERPTVLLSCGAGIAPPIFLAGKLIGCKLIFIDSYTFLSYPSLSARIIALFGDRTCTQHKCISNKNKRFHYWGTII